MSLSAITKPTPFYQSVEQGPREVSLPTFRQEAGQLISDLHLGLSELYHRSLLLLIEFIQMGCDSS